MTFWLWNSAGWLAMRLGCALYGAGLALCGLAGSLDARADSAWLRETLGEKP